MTATMDVFRDGVRVPINFAGNSVTTSSTLVQPIDPNIASGVGLGTVNVFSGPVPAAKGLIKTSPAALKVMGPSPVANVIKR